MAPPIPEAKISITFGNNNLYTLIIYNIHKNLLLDIVQTINSDGSN